MEDLILFFDFISRRESILGFGDGGGGGGWIFSFFSFYFLFCRRLTEEGELMPFHQHEMHCKLDSMSGNAFSLWPVTACHVGCARLNFLPPPPPIIIFIGYSWMKWRDFSRDDVWLTLGHHSGQSHLRSEQKLPGSREIRNHRHTWRCQSVNVFLLYYPVMLSHFSPAPVKTDRAVRIQ